MPKKFACRIKVIVFFIIFCYLSFNLWPCSVGINHFWLVWFVGFFPVLLVGLVDQPVQQAQTSVETVENDG